jgi:hypothetical protein
MSAALRDTPVVPALPGFRPAPAGPVAKAAWPALATLAAACLPAAYLAPLSLPVLMMLVAAAAAPLAWRAGPLLMRARLRRWSSWLPFAPALAHLAAGGDATSPVMAALLGGGCAVLALSALPDRQLRRIIGAVALGGLALVLLAALDPVVRGALGRWFRAASGDPAAFGATALLVPLTLTPTLFWLCAARGQRWLVWPMIGGFALLTALGDEWGLAAAILVGVVAGALAVLTTPRLVAGLLAVVVLAGPAIAPTAATAPCRAAAVEVETRTEIAVAVALIERNAATGWGIDAQPRLDADCVPVARQAIGGLLQLWLDLGLLGAALAALLTWIAGDRIARRAATDRARAMASATLGLAVAGIALAPALWSAPTLAGLALATGLTAAILRTDQHQPGA